MAEYSEEVGEKPPAVESNESIGMDEEGEWGEEDEGRLLAKDEVRAEEDIQETPDPKTKSKSSSSRSHHRSGSERERRKKHRHHHHHGSSRNSEKRRRKADVAHEGDEDADGGLNTREPGATKLTEGSTRRRSESLGDTSDPASPRKHSSSNPSHDSQRKSSRSVRDFDIDDAGDRRHEEGRMARDRDNRSLSSEPKNIGSEVKDEEAEDGEILEDGELDDDDDGGEDCSGTKTEGTEGPPSKSSNRDDHSRSFGKYSPSERRKGQASDYRDRRKRDAEDKKRRKRQKLYKDHSEDDEEDGQGKGRSSSPPSNTTSVAPAWGSGVSQAAASSKTSPSPAGSKQRYSKAKDLPGLYDSPSYSEDSEDEMQHDSHMSEAYHDTDDKEYGGLRRPKKRNRDGMGDSRKRGRDGGPLRKKSLMEMAMSERPVCKFYMDGKCAKGSGCQFNHDIEGPRMKLEVCKYHLTVKGCHREHCLYMHENYPCKYYHTGAKCFSGDRCKFSHAPLTEDTRRALALRVAEEDIVDMEDPDYADYKDYPARDYEDSDREHDDEDYNDSHEYRRSQNRPSLLGSPPRMRVDRKIPSLFEIKVTPPGQSPQPGNAGQVVSRQSGFPNEANPTPHSSSGPIGLNSNAGGMGSAVGNMTTGNMNQQQQQQVGMKPGLLGPGGPINTLPRGPNPAAAMMFGMQAQQQQMARAGLNLNNTGQFMGQGNAMNMQQRQQGMLGNANNSNMGNNGNLPPPVLNMLGTLIRDLQSGPGTGQNSIGPMGQGNMMNMGQGNMGNMNNMNQNNIGQQMGQNNMGNIRPNNMSNVGPNNVNNMGPNNINNMNMGPNNMSNMGSNNMNNMGPNNMNNMGSNNMNNMGPNNMNNMGPNNMNNMLPNNMNSQGPALNVPPNSMSNMGPTNMSSMLATSMNSMGPNSIINMGPNNMTNIGPNNMNNINPNNMISMGPNGANNLGPNNMSMGPRQATDVSAMGLAGHMDPPNMPSGKAELHNKTAEMSGPNFGINSRSAPGVEIANPGQEVGIMDVDYRLGQPPQQQRSNNVVNNDMAEDKVAQQDVEQEGEVDEESSQDLSELDRMRRQIQEQIRAEDEAAAAADNSGDQDKIMQEEEDKDERSRSKSPLERVSPNKDDNPSEKKGSDPVVSIPSHLPRTQRELLKRIQQQEISRQREKERQEAAERAVQEADSKDDFEYSSEEEEGGDQKQPKLTEVLKMLNKETPAPSVSSATTSATTIADSASSLVSSSSSSSSSAATVTTAAPPAFNIMQMIQAIKSKSNVGTASAGSPPYQPSSDVQVPHSESGKKSQLSPPASPADHMASSGPMGFPLKPLTVDPPVVSAKPSRPLTYSIIKLTLSQSRPYVDLPADVTPTNPKYRSDPRVKWHVQYMEKQKKKAMAVAAGGEVSGAKEEEADKKRRSSLEEATQDSVQKPAPVVTDPRLKKTDPRLQKAGSSPNSSAAPTRPTDPRLEKAANRPTDPRLAARSMDPRLNRQTSLQGQMGGGMTDQMGGGMNSQMGGGFNQFGGGMNSSLGGGMNNPMGMGSGMNNPMGSGMNNPMARGMNINQMGGMNNQMGGMMNNAMGSGINNMSAGMNNQMGGGMNNQMLGNMNSQMSGGMNNQMIGGMNSQMGRGLNNQMRGGMNNQMGGGMMNQGGFRNNQMGSMSSGPMGRMGPMNNMGGMGSMDQRGINVMGDNNMNRTNGNTGGGMNMGMGGQMRPQMQGGIFVGGSMNQMGGNSNVGMGPMSGSSGGGVGQMGMGKASGMDQMNSRFGGSQSHAASSATSTDPRLRGRGPDPRDFRDQRMAPDSRDPRGVSDPRDPRSRDPRAARQSLDSADGGSSPSGQNKFGWSAGDDRENVSNSLSFQGAHNPPPFPASLSQPPSSSLPSSLSLPLPSLSPPQSNSISLGSSDKSANPNVSNFDHRNDPRFKRVKRTPGPRASSMDYSSPLSGEQTTPSSADPSLTTTDSTGYNSYNRPKHSPSNPGRLDRHVDTPSPSLPDTLEDFDMPDNTASDVKVKDIFKSIDPTASPFC